MLLRPVFLFGVGFLAIDCSPAVAGEAILHSFAGGTDGAYPAANLIFNSNVLYGTTPGSSSVPGTAFKVTKGGAETVLSQFSAATGMQPIAGLLYLNGLFYGTTAAGGAYGGGTVFSMTPGGAISVVYSFGNGSDGSSPAAGLAQVGGYLFGTTAYGGANGKGIVFRLTTAGKETILHSFGGTLDDGTVADGATPQGGLVYVSSKLWGSTEYGGTFTGVGCVTKGCGTVYSISTGGAYTQVYAFKGGTTDGQWPLGNLTAVSTTLYGTTLNAGAHDWGTAFSITTGGTEKLIHSFNLSVDGGAPTAGLVYVGGAFYGTASFGGPGGNGTIYSMTPAGATTVLYGFGSVANDGNGPESSLTYTTSGSTISFYGTTNAGGAYNLGTVFSYTK